MMPPMERPCFKGGRLVPSSHNPYRLQTKRLTRRDVLRVAIMAGGGLAGIALLGCGGEEEEKGTPTALLPTVAPSGFFDSDGVKIHYETFGQGKPIVLVHGFPISFELNWVGTKWVEALQPVRRVVGLDCRGFGDSEKPRDPDAYGIENMAGDVLRLMAHLGIDKADLFGYSMGAMISAYLLINNSERFTTVILGGVGNLFEPGREEQMRKSADYLLIDDPSQITDPFGKTFRAIADGIPGNDRLALAACSERLFEPFAPADFAAVDIPVLFISGANDTSAGSPATMAAATPASELVLIPDTDHFTVIPDQRFKDAVLAFLREH
jgi:pimeloyl-ACP methyl ester carboxylesterase